MKHMVFLLATTVLVGCSAPQKSSRLVPNQYCFTNQTLETQDQKSVSSKTTVKCSDDPLEKYVPAKMGISKDCYVSYIPMNRNGQLIKEKIYVCQKFNGSYDVIEPVRLY